VQLNRQDATDDGRTTTDREFATEAQRHRDGRQKRLTDDGRSTAEIAEDAEVTKAKRATDDCGEMRGNDG